MAFAQRYDLTVTTASSSGSATTPIIPYGVINSIAYTTGATGFTTGCDFTVTTTVSSQVVWVESNVEASRNMFPRVEVRTTAGTTVGRYAPIAIANEAIKVDVVSAGDGKTGSFSITIV